jgi:hypothetical protein
MGLHGLLEGYILFYLFLLVIDNPASCEISAVICFLHAKNVSAAEIRRKLCAAVYGPNVLVISEGTVRQWFRIFKDGLENKRSR